jgi:hypothetical protein
MKSAQMLQLNGLLLPLSSFHLSVFISSAEHVVRGEVWQEGFV